mmetsp:Transcript_21211/g.68372  ORF Transcript_21211/g.68372 Transcript_21211/m.68372 type:complete len:317 (+) Transcript_21211:403-1353(+)
MSSRTKCRTSSPTATPPATGRRACSWSRRAPPQSWRGSRRTRACLARSPAGRGSGSASRPSGRTSGRGTSPRRCSSRWWSTPWAAARRPTACATRRGSTSSSTRSSTSTRWWRTSVSTASATSSWSRSSAACAASRRASAASPPGGQKGKEGSAVSQEAERCENRRVPPLLGGRLPELCPLRRGDAHSRLEGCRRRGGGGQGGHVRRHDGRAPRVPQAVGLRQGVCQHPGRGSWRQEEGCLSQHVEGRRPPCAVRSRRVCISFLSWYLLRLGCRVRGLRELLVTARILITTTRRSGRALGLGVQRVGTDTARPGPG